MAVLIFCGTLAAQEPNPTDLGGLSIEDLTKLKIDAVYGASKFLEKASDAPASVTVVTAEEIQQHGYRTLADVLRSVRGFYVINDRNYTYVGLRGLSHPGDYNDRILFLVDGHRVNDDIFDGAYVGTEFPVDLDLIDRIEIIRGPNSSIYGTGAFAAVINVVTKRGRDLAGIEVSTQAGSWNSYKGRATYGKRYDNGLEVLFSGSFYNSQGHRRLFFPEFDSPATNNGVADNADADQSYTAFGEIIYRDLDIHLVQGSRTKHVPTAPFGTVFNDPRTETTDARSYVDLQYHRAFGGWETLGRLSYDWYGYHGIYIYDYAGKGIPPYTRNYDAASGAWWDFQGDAQKTFFARHKVTFGMEFRQDLKQRQVNYDIQPYFLYLDDRHTARVWALYFQDEYSLRKNLIFVAGFRSDWYSRFRATLSPRLGLLYNPEPGTDFKATFSTAFRAPNSYESYYAVSVSNTANPQLQPERIHGWELDVEHRFGKSYYASGAAFLNRIDDLIEQRLDPSTGTPIYVNSTPIETRGIEAEWGVRWPHGLEASLSDTLQDSRVLATRNVLTNSPKQLPKLSLSVPLARDKLVAAADAQYVSKRRTIAGTNLGGYFLMNLTLFSRTLANGWDFSSSLYNVFDKRYAESGGLEHVQTAIPQDGRSFRITLTYRPRRGER
ncbi:MAG TPA: TonB-dependent receptor [Candidatus Acidoferrales bacterium]|nr:TonB-dependent receptor [Candidatus Acidoferrales bacterium]